ncbi:MAG TPA: hypothetical protein VN684_02825 [Terriglobales bacterium]|nr:hypothetical protein [Terriglobales bacterium]
MKEKTSVTLSSDVLSGIDRLAGPRFSRSAFIERVLRHYLKEQARIDSQTRDLERINRASDRLNFEAAEVLAFQISED